MTSSYRTSFAFDGMGGASWQWYTRDGVDIPITEIGQHVEAMERREGRLAAVEFRSAIHVKLRLAMEGRLQDPDDGRPQLQLIAGIMEIKWGVDADQWRLYYSEPLPLYAERVMLGLHFAQKDDTDQQNEQIREAARRWAWWNAQAAR